MTKKLLFRIITVLTLFITVSCYTSDDNYSSLGRDVPCGYHNGKQLYKGPKGGCYYINSNGNKSYVDRSKCNC